MDLFEQYACLLSKSYKFLEKENNEVAFLDSLNSYLKNTSEYDFNDGRLEFIICQPFLLSMEENKSIILVLNRCLDNGKKVERIKLISAKLIDKKWLFKVNKGYTRSFSYEGDVPVLSDQEITLRLLRNLIDEEYLLKNSCEINESFFINSWRYDLKE